MNWRPWLVIMALGTLILSCFGLWLANSGYSSYAMSMAWPGLLLARFGIPFGWTLVLILLLGLPTAMAVCFSTKPWFGIGIAGVLLPTLYCAIALYWMRVVPPPDPGKSNYDEIPKQRAMYVEGFEAGYFWGLNGRMVTICFAPEAMEAGHAAGIERGLDDFSRFLGWRPQNLPPRPKDQQNPKPQKR